MGDTIGSLSSRAHPGVGEDSRNYSSLHRVIGYMAPYHVGLRELREIGREVLGSHNQTFVAYLETSDAVLHVEGRRAAEKFLIRLDAFLQELQADVRERTGRDLFVDIVSDHGSTMVKGRVVPVERLLRRCGYHRRGRITNPDDVAYSLAGIIGSVAISTSGEHPEEAARCLAVADGVDLVAVDRGDAVGVFTADGMAEVRLVGTSPETYEYRALRGDPLGLLQGMTAVTARRFDESSLFIQTIDAQRPDPLRRLWWAFHGEVKQPSPVLVSLADGYEAGNTKLFALAKMRGRAGTHGSMTRLATLGVLASNWRAVDDVDSRGANEALFGAGIVTAMRRALSERLAGIDHSATGGTQTAGRVAISAPVTQRSLLQ